MNIKKIFILLLLLNLNYVYAQSVEPDVFVQSTVNRASEVLAKNISKEDKINKLKLIAKDTVDIRGIGFYTLGSFRKNLSENQKNEYLDLFEDYFLKSFSSRLSEYTNPKIEVQNKKNLSTNYKILTKCDAILICLPTPLKNYRPDMSYVFNCAKKFK